MANVNNAYQALFGPSPQGPVTFGPPYKGLPPVQGPQQPLPTGSPALSPGLIASLLGYPVDLTNTLMGNVAPQPYGGGQNIQNILSAFGGGIENLLAPNPDSLVATNAVKSVGKGALDFLAPTLGLSGNNPLLESYRAGTGNIERAFTETSKQQAERTVPVAQETPAPVGGTSSIEDTFNARIGGGGVSYPAVGGTDLSAIKELLAAPRPGEEKDSGLPLDEKFSDISFLIASALGGTGSGDANSTGELLAQLGGGAAGGVAKLGQYKKAEKKEAAKAQSEFQFKKADLALKIFEEDREQAKASAPQFINTKDGLVVAYKVKGEDGQVRTEVKPFTGSAFEGGKNASSILRAFGVDPKNASILGAKTVINSNEPFAKEQAILAALDSAGQLESVFSEALASPELKKILEGVGKGSPELLGSTAGLAQLNKLTQQRKIQFLSYVLSKDKTLRDSALTALSGVE